MNEAAGSEMITGEEPDFLGIGSGEFAAPGEAGEIRLRNGGEFDGGAGIVFAQHFAGGFEIRSSEEKLAELHHLERAQHGIGRGEQQKGLGQGAGAFLETDEQTNPGAIDKLDGGHIEHTGFVRNQGGFKNGFIAVDRLEIEPGGHAEEIIMNFVVHRERLGSGNIGLAGAQTPGLGGDGSAEIPEIVEITFGEAARFLGETKDPFGAAALHPARGASDFAREKIDGGADADGNRDAERAVMHVDPFFLLGAAETNKEEIGVGGLDALADFLVVHIEELVKGRRIITSDIKGGILAGDIGDGLLGGIFAGTEEKGTVALFGSKLDEKGDDVRAGDAFGQRITEEFGGPNERGAVAEDEVSIKQNTAEFDIFGGLGEKIDVGRGEVVGTARDNHLLDEIDGFLCADIVKGHSQNRNRGRLGVERFMLKLVHFRAWL